MQEISTEEFNRLDPLKKSAHPDQVASELLGFISRVGSQKFLTGAGYNKERDSFVAALFTYAIRKWSKREWFIQQLSDPPDFYVISPTNRPIANKPLDRGGVEIVEVRTEDPDEAIEIIQRTKLEAYKPEPGTHLLIFLNTKSAVSVGIKLSQWAIRNRVKFSSFSELYCLYLVSFSPTTTWTYRLLNIFKSWDQTCVLSEEFNKGVLFPHPLIDKYRVRII